MKQNDLIDNVKVLPKGYKQTEFGLVPEPWKIESLGNIGSFHKGKGISKSELIELGIPCVTYGELYTIHHNIIRQFKSFISIDSARRSFQLEKGDILLAGSGETANEIGKAVAFDFDFTAYAGGDIVVFRQNKQISHFLGYALNHEIANRQKFKMGQGNSVVHIYTSSLKNLMVLLPTIPEQKKIVNILNTWDEAIKKTQATIEQLKKRNKGLAQLLLTGSKRLKGFNSNWTLKKAENVFKNQSNKSHNGHLEVLSATQDKGVLPRSMVNIDIKFDENSIGTYKKVEIGDFVISLRSFQGGIEYSPYEGLVSPAYTVLKEIVPVSKTFFRVYFKTETFINKLNTIIYGIRDGKQISYKEFATLKLPFPSLEEQEVIAGFLENGETELNFYQKRLDVLRLQKRGLLQKLLTGEIIVKIK